MPKKKIVDGLIADKATAWGDDDRESLMAMDEAVLGKMAPVAAVPPSDPPATPPEGDTTPAPAAPVVTPAGTPEVSPITMQQALDAMPAPLRETMQDALATTAAQKAALITEITANEGVDFSAEFLASKTPEELRGWAKGLKAAAPVALVVDPNAPVPMFNGQGVVDPAFTANGGGEHANGEEPLEITQMQFDN